MARRRARPVATREESLEPACATCPACGRTMWAAYTNRRTLVTLAALLRLRLLIRRCPHADCSRYRRPYRPEAEGSLALPEHEFGLDVIALIGALRYGQHQSVPEMHRTPLTPEVVEAIRSAPPVLSPCLIPVEHDPSRPVSRSVLNDWMRKVKERAGVDVERLGFHACKRAGIRTREFRALPAKVQEQLTGTTHAMLRAVYDEVPFEELPEAMETLRTARRRA